MIKINGRSILLPLYIAITIFFICFTDGILMPFIIGGVIAYLANPAIKYISNKTGLSTKLVSLCTITLIVSLLLTALILFLPIVYKEISSIAIKISNRDISKISSDLLDTIYTFVPSVFAPIIMDWVVSIPPYLFHASQNIMKDIVMSTGTIINAAISIIISPVIAYYILRDQKYIKHFLLHLIPISMHHAAQECCKHINQVSNLFLRGQVMIALVWSLYYTSFFSIIGLKTSIALGIFSGLSCLIPYIGAIFSLLVVIFVSILQFEGITSELHLAIAVYAAGHTLDIAWVSNRFLGKRLGLHPLLTIFSLVFSASFFGIFGMFAAIPSMVLIKKGFLFTLYKLKAHEKYHNHFHKLSKKISSPK